ncbi:hypothetical protein BJI62_04275 [Acinetobacter pittii]|nr:hypothetical protein BJI62_04275 [Acinetobacter pittii]
MINKVLIVLCVGIVFVLGYWAYLDTQNKRHQELMQIIQEAEKNLQSIERNPNHAHHSNLASFHMQQYIGEKKNYFLTITSYKFLTFYSVIGHIFS